MLTPQTPKFLKSLLPVKEENKVKTSLESRPLLGQEVVTLFTVSPPQNEENSCFFILCHVCPSSMKLHFHCVFDFLVFIFVYIFTHLHHRMNVSKLA